MTANANPRWTTKEQVLNDLTEVMGLTPRHDDDDYIIRGTRPPPPRRDLDVDEEEFNLMFGAAGDMRNRPIVEERQEPDLDGIAHMLRMVNESTEPEECLNWQKSISSTPQTGALVITKKKSPVNWRERNSPRPDLSKTIASSTHIRPTIGQGSLPRYREDNIVLNSKLSKNRVSKKALNPETPCFIPKSLKPFNNVSMEQMTGKDLEQTTSISKQVDDDAKCAINRIESKIENAKNNVTSFDKAAVTNVPEKIENRVDEDFKKLNTQQEEVELLKKKIIEASKADKKREKNVAMAALLRLKSAPRSSTPSLKTSPEERSAASSKAQSPVVLESEKLREVHDPIIETKPIPKSSKNLLLYTPQYFETKITNATIKQDTSDTTIERVNTPTEENIQKDVLLEQRVIDWMDDVKVKTESPITVKSPVKLQLITKPFGFTKRKNVASPVAEPAKPKHVTEAIPTYVPSRNATLLAQQYEEAMREDKVPSPSRSNGFLTEAIVQQLKTKDEEFRKRKELTTLQ